MSGELSKELYQSPFLKVGAAQSSLRTITWGDLAHMPSSSSTILSLTHVFLGWKSCFYFSKFQIIPISTPLHFLIWVFKMLFSHVFNTLIGINLSYTLWTINRTEKPVMRNPYGLASLSSLKCSGEQNSEEKKKSLIM